jgi:hypothetical protein
MTSEHVQRLLNARSDYRIDMTSQVPFVDVQRSQRSLWHASAGP